jgi:UDP-GlcNAc:undecaprenyl-phosphate GlcNAc-1-phosphate transferase
VSQYLVIFLLALCGAWAVTPLARRAALHLGIVDAPGGRKAHHAPMPYLGGLAIYAAFMLFLLVAVSRNAGDPNTPFVQALAIVAGATLMVVLGLIDDRYTLNPIVKLAGQVLAAALLYFAHIHFHFNHFPWLDLPVSMIWVVGITNAFNLLDNMDGLSVGTAAIGCAYFFTLAELESTKQFIVASMAIALLGACLGFLYYNFNPARIFMGDAGSLFLGFTLSVLGLKINMNGFPNLHAVNFFVPVVVLGIPVFDTTLVTISRLRRHVPVGRGGTDHTSHRLVLVGLTVREAVMAVYIVAGALGLAGILLTVAGLRSGLALVGMIAVAGIVAGYHLEKVYRAHEKAAVSLPDGESEAARIGIDHVAANLTDGADERLIASHMQGGERESPSVIPRQAANRR